MINVEYRVKQLNDLGFEYVESKRHFKRGDENGYKTIDHDIVVYASEIEFEKLIGRLSR